MSRVVIFGGNGLIGHYLLANLQMNCELIATLHGKSEELLLGSLKNTTLVYGIDAADVFSIRRILDTFRPDWAINAIGLVKRPLALDRLASLEANTLFPIRLASLCGERGIRLIHFSTDCVFDGQRGNYSEADLPNSPDWHGRCKALGEPTGEHVLVFRTSFVGLELACKKSLVEWFLAQRGATPGYTKAIWSGLTAAEIARLASRLIDSHTPPPSGLWHLASREPISKFELLSKLNSRLGKRDCVVVPDDSFVCDRSLNGQAFYNAFNYSPPSYDYMLNELAEEILRRDHQRT